MIARGARAVLPFVLVIRAALAQPPSTVEDQVRALYDAGQWTEAARAAGATAAPSASLLFYRGLALARLQNFTEAAAAFSRGAEQFRRDKRFPLELAGISYRDGRFRAAKSYLHRALKLDASDRYGQDFLATLYLLDRNLPAAVEHWNKIAKPLIEDVRFEPAPPLQTVLLERTFDISGGQLFTADRLDLTQANLVRLHVLDATQFDLIPRQQDDRFDLTVRSTPIAQPLGGWVGKLAPLLGALPYQAVAFDLFNLRRDAMNFSSLWRWDPNKRRINLSLSAPWRDNPRVEYNYFIDARDETWDLSSQSFAAHAGVPGLSLRRLQAGAGFEIGLSPRLQWTLGGLLTYRDFRNAPQTRFFATGWSLELDNRLDYRLWSWPDERVRVSGWASLQTGRYFTRDTSRLITVRGGLEAAWYPQARGEVYRLGEQLQLGRSFGETPLDELFILGMERDNDYGLWFRGAVGTNGGRKGSAAMGREYAISQTDFARRLLRIPFVRVDAGPFFDAAWSGDPSGAFGSQGGLYATGLEAKVRTIGSLNVRFVYGHDLGSGRDVFYTAVSR